MKQPKIQILSRSNVEHGSNRPYAALMYMGYTYLDSSMYDKAYIEPKYGSKHPIHKIAISNTSILIIYDDKSIFRLLNI